MEKAQKYAEGVINDPVVEFAWAEVAAKHAETHFKLLTSFADSTKLNLTKLDDEIYKHFRQVFPELRVDVLDYDAMKTDAAKSEWRDFFQPYEQRVHQFNFATLLRVNSSDEEGYWEKNTVIVPRIQFLAIEIARNKEGYNKKLYDALQSKKK